MENGKGKLIDIKDVILKNNEEIEVEREENFVNLVIDIIVSSTLKEYYETSDKIPSIQPTRAK
ncbi:hypothetical protein ACR78G_21105 [Sphingobacterium spiritivorum]|uniref:hypothetical protein n=1 Tax=Sphingobacterium spiritivorum TaxID=258 RepID=UPI003DA1DB37